MRELSIYDNYELSETAKTQSLQVNTETEKTKATAEIQSAVFMARKFPRDEIRAYKRIMDAAKRVKLAEKALYCYPRGGETVKGASIRTAETIAKYWGNIDFGIKELSQNINNHTSEVMAYAWDLETNTRQVKVFTVQHVRYSKKNGFTNLTDPRDIYEKVANDGARRLRACILGILPSDIIDDFIEQAEKTLENSSDKPFADRLKDMVVKFEQIGVSQEMLEKRVGTRMSNFIPKNLVDLGAVYNSIKNNFASVDKFFDLPTLDDKKVDEVSKKLLNGAKNDTK